MKALGENVIRRVVECNGMPLAPRASPTARKGQKIRHKIEVALDVLGSQTTIRIKDNPGDMACDLEVGGVGSQLRFQPG
jgi:hypothetical protein